MDERRRKIQSTVLTRFGADQWTVGDAIEGVQIFGATGSGKTTGSGDTLARAFLDPQLGCYGGFGGLVLTAKDDECGRWARLLEQAGRGNDLLVLGPNDERVRGESSDQEAAGGKRFNFLAYEQAQSAGGGLTQNLVTLFLDALSGSGEATKSGKDPYWDEAVAELLTHTIDLAVLSGALSQRENDGGHSLDLKLLFEIVRSAPQRIEEAQSTTWRETSRCAQLIVEAERRRKEASSEASKSGRGGDLDQTQAYWLRDFPALAQRTRSIVVSSFTAKAAGLLRSPLRELFCSGPSKGELDELAPERTFEGKVLVLNLPVNKVGEVGRFAQVLYKTIWQRAVLRRELTGDWRPVFLWADESQYFITKRDALFQQTARAKFSSTVYLTQNLPNYHAALASGSGTHATESLLGNLQTKIFHANGDPATNEWASRVFAARDVTSVSGGAQAASARSQTTMGKEPRVPAARFTSLRTGGLRDRATVEGYVMQAGRSLMQTGGDIRPCTFKQEF